MKKSAHFNRRSFIKLSAAGAIGSSPLISTAGNFFQNNTEVNPLKVYIFSKTLQFLDYEELSKVVKEIGFDGVDLTVRPKGHVLPENVTVDLPKATKAMQKAGLLTDMISTKAVDPSDPSHVKVLEEASKLGYSLYRTGWIKYPKDAPIQESLVTYRKQLLELSKLNEKLGITGGYQNHAGNYLGAPVWDLKQMFEGVNPKDLGVQYDIMHATVEGAQSWQLGLELIKEHLNSLVIKDFKWVEVDGKWKRKYMPLGEGMVDFDRYFKFLKKHQIHLPISMHYEYDLGGAEHGKTPTMDKEVIYAKLKKDLLFLRNAWAKVNK